MKLPIISSSATMASDSSIFGGQCTRSSTAVLVEPEKHRVGDERRDEQRKLGEDGADHPA